MKQDFNLEIVYRLISDLTPAEYNPRKLSDKQRTHIRASIDEFGLVDPIIVNKHPDRLNVIVGGHQRVKVCKDMGIMNIPTTEVCLTKEKEKALNVRLNKNTGEFDNEVLAEFYDKEELLELGFEEDELDFFDTEELEAEEDNFTVPDEDEIKTNIALGDLIEIGPHRLFCGDSNERNNFNTLLIKDKKFTLITDPPYGIGIDGQKESKSKNPKHNRKKHEFKGWDNERPNAELFNLILSFCENGVIWGGNYFADLLPASRGWLYWSKGQDGLTMSDGELAWTTEHKPLRAVVVNRGALRGSVHPTQKPVEVIKFSINFVGGENVLLDSFLGSGTTMVTAHQLNRVCYGMELDPKYCQVILDRMVALDSTLEVKINGTIYNGKD